MHYKTSLDQDMNIDILFLPHFLQAVTLPQIKWQNKKKKCPNEFIDDLEVVPPINTGLLNKRGQFQEIETLNY